MSDNTDREEIAKADYMSFEGTDPAVSNEIAALVSEVWGGYVPLDVRFGIAHELQRRLPSLGWVKADELADRLDAAESSSYDTGRGGEPGYEYPIWEEGQGLGRIFAVSASDFIREVIRRSDTTKEPTP